MLTLDEAKVHLRVDGSDEDSYIEGLVAVASEYVQGMVTPAAADGAEPVVPAVNETQRHAARLLVGHWYENREAVAQGTIVPKVPFAVEMLLTFNRPAESFF
ncbi:uncharacterized phage protein (possible DNA packaging) [Cribrihabitans marinus]|uniref:Uncharacterized phage protein (Possible DNA packaging) n=1 Tax=Cribrihabitans marinus TaxID=1227549 RepID=A0A1H6WDF5_9RHOB|nr:head-tail connector protein [Cribrihabitans marinus]GGH24454.1 hypothetical protein GCM10010973_10970 [Cribrihabitans marinus]SEJ13264.1 uncharacterized phage protein (possible DNA packaging) [Cribrihabitans marinus]